MDYDFVYGGDENAQRGDEKPKDANSWVTFTYVQDREFYEYSYSFLPTFYHEMASVQL